MRLLNQSTLIKNINRYLEFKNRKLSLNSGYCHGLTLLWLFEMSSGTEDWFYNTITLINDCENIHDFEINESEIERFISYIEWLQHSANYLYSVNQLDTDKLTGLNKELSISFLFHHSQLNSLLDHMLCDDKFITISSVNHTVGLTKNNDRIYLFDANYNGMKPKEFTDINLLKFELVKCLFNRNYLPEPRLPLEISILSGSRLMPINHQKSCDNKKLTELYSSLIKQSGDIDKPGLGKITNMYLACESGDECLVHILLTNGSSPDQRFYNDWSPIHISSAKGYTSIVKLLLKYGANPAISRRDGMTALDLARVNGHDDTAKMLAEYNHQ